MENLTLFINSFLSYLLVFVLIVVLVIAACMIGVKLRKKKDEKDVMALESAAGQGQETAEE